MRETKLLSQDAGDLESHSPVDLTIEIVSREAALAGGQGIAPRSTWALIRAT